MGKKKNKKITAEEEKEEKAEPTEEDAAEAKKAAKAAKKAAKAAAAALGETEEIAEAPKAKKKKEKADDNEAEEAEEPVKKRQKSEDGEAKSSEAESFRLFVGGIAWSVDEDTLRKDFAECGEVTELRLLMDRDTGNSRGIAFITMADKKGYDAALAYDGEDYAGRKLNVSAAKDDGEKGKGKAGKGKDKGKGKGKGKGKKKPEGCTSVVVKGLSYEVTEEDLNKCFKACGGGPTNVKVLMDRETGASRGMAFVDFDDTSAVDEAMKLSETNLKGRAFYMDYSVPKESSW